MTPEQAKALQDYYDSVDTYTKRNPDQYQSVGNLSYDRLGSSAMGDISTDPQYKQYELSALKDLEDRSQNGFTARDLADQQATENAVNRANQGRIGAIQQQMQARGLSGGGLDLMAQMDSSQQANELAASRALEMNAQRESAKSNASQQLGQLSGQMQSRDFQQQAAKAEAADRINQFNVQNANQAAQWNQQNRQNVANSNVSGANQWAQQQYQAKTGRAQMGYDAATDDYNQAQMRKADRARRQAAMTGAVLGTAGAIGGSMMGPAGTVGGSAMGAMAGYQVGNGLGNAFGGGGYAYGGPVDGEAFFPDDDPRNDTIDARLSPGEIVIPRSAASSPESAAAFAADSANSMRGKYDEYGNYTPSALEQYRKDSAKASDDLASAQELKKNLGWANIAGNIATDLGNSQKRSVVLANRMGEMGRAPQQIAAPTQKWDNSTLDRMGQGAVDLAMGQQGAARQRFSDRTNMDQLDPNSDVSRQANMILQNVLLNKAAEASKANDSASADRLRTLAGSASFSAKDAMDQAKMLKDMDWKDVISADTARMDAKVKADATTEAAAARRDAMNLNKRDRDDLRASQLHDKMVDNLKKDLDPNAARGGNLAKSQAMLNSADRVNALFQQFPDGNVPAAQTSELAAAVAGLVNGGSAQSQHQIDTLTPSSMRGDYNKIASWITNNPRGAEQQAYLQMMHETAMREGDVAKGQVKAAQVQRLAAHGRLKQEDPDTYNALLRSYGVDENEIDSNGRYAPQQGAGNQQQVTIEAPDGTRMAVPKGSVQKYLQKGGRLVQ